LTKEDRKLAKKQGLKSFYHFVKEGRITEEEFNALEKLFICTIELKVDAKRLDMDQLVDMRYDPLKHRCDKLALKIKYEYLRDAAIDLTFQKMDIFWKILHAVCNIENTARVAIGAIALLRDDFQSL